MGTEQETEKKKIEIGLYEKFAARAKDIMDEAKEKTSEAVEVAIEKAKEEMIEAGEFGREQGEKFKAFLERDTKIARENLVKVGQSAMEMLNPGRVSAGLQNVLVSILDQLGEKFEDWSKKVESGLDYKAGELTSPGTLVCKKCKNEIHMKVTGHVPVCPKCNATEFHKTY